MSDHSTTEEFIENKKAEKQMDSAPFTPGEIVSNKSDNKMDVHQAGGTVTESRYTGGAISYSLKDHSSSDESSDEGQDVYVPSFAIPSHSISHDEPFTSPDSKFDGSFEVEQRNHGNTEDGDIGHSDIKVEKSNVGAESDQNIDFNENNKSDNGDQNELENLAINESKVLITDIKQKPDAGNTDIEFNEEEKKYKIHLTNNSCLSGNELMTGKLSITDNNIMMNKCTFVRKTEPTEVSVDSLDVVDNMVDRSVSERDKSNDVSLMEEGNKPTLENMEVTKESGLLMGFQELGEKNGLDVLEDSPVYHTSAQQENGQIFERGVNENSSKTDQSETEHVQNKTEQNVEPAASPREETLYNRQHSNPGFQYGGQFQNMHNIPPTMPYYPPPLTPNHFYPFQPYLPVRPDWNHQHVQQSKLLDVQPALSDCKGDNSPDLRETSSKSASTTSDDSKNQKEEKKQNVGTECIVNSGTGKEFENKNQQDNTKEKKDNDELFKSLVDSQSTPYPSERQGSKIIVTFSGDISEHTLTYYFENTRKSGGGEIQNMDFSPDTGVAVIVFKDRESAENVLKKDKIHKVSDINLEIHLIERESDLASVLEENMVFVKGIKPTTTKDCLWDYLEVKTGFEPTDMRYGCDTTCAMVMFEDKIDFGRLQEGCRKKPLESYTLTVSRVPVTSSVLVTGFNSEVSRDSVQYYFENERRSGGDENLEMVEFDSTACVIRFPSPLVAKRVCDKKEQKIGGCLLDVCLYYDFLGRKKNVEKPDPEILSADSSVLKFLKNSPKHKQEFEDKLKNLSACVEWPADFETDETKITCDLDLTSSEGQKGVSTWGTKVTEFTNKFMSSFTSIKITSLRESWEDVKQGLRSLNVPDPEKVCVILEPNNHAITIVGDESVVTDLYREVQKIVSDAEGKASQKNHSSTKTISYKIYKLQLLWRLKCFDTLMERFPGVDAQCNLDKREVTLSGDIEKMQAAELYLREMENSFVRKPFKMSKNKKDLLSKKGARDIWYQETKKKQIIATWNVDHGACEMYAQSNEEVERAIICMEDLFIEDEILDSDKFTQSSRWEELLKKLNERDQNCFVIKSSYGKIQLAATKYIFHEVKSDIEKEIDEFTNLDCEQQKTIYCDKGIYLWMGFHSQKELQNIESCSKVKITSNKQKFVFVIEGNKRGIDQASQKISELMNCVNSDEHIIYKFGLRDYFLSQSGKRDVLDISKRHSSVVLPDTDYSIEKARKAQKKSSLKLSSAGVKQVFVHDENHKVYLVEDDITQLKVDAIVNAANNDMDHCGGLAKAIVDAAGMSVQKECHDYIKHKGKVRDGDAIMSGPGLLPCKAIIHAVGPQWKGGNLGEEPLLKAAVLQCLILTEKSQFESVAIPALSGGIFGYPLDKCTNTIVRTIKEYFDYNRYTSVTSVYLCDVSPDTIRMFQAALKTVYHADNEQPVLGQQPLKYPDHTESPGMTSAMVPITYPHHTEKRTYPDHTDKRTYPDHTDRRTYPHHTEQRTASSNADFITVVKGLLTERQVDVIVNSISQDLDLSHGRLSRSILMAAGDIIQTEIYQHIDTFKPYKSVVATSGGKMNCTIIHGTLSPFDGQDGNGVMILQQFIDNCLKTCAEKDMKSIAFPAVGTGVLSFPEDTVAKLMFERVIAFKKKYPDSSIQKVEFVIFPKDTATIKAFNDFKQRLTGQDTSHGADDSHMARAPADVESRTPRQRPMNKGGNQSTKLGDVNVVVKCGDITKENSDVIVNCTSKSLDLSKGAVSKAILTAAGEGLQREIYEAAMGSEDKSLIVTSGGKMNCKHVFHFMAQSSLPKWQAGVTKCLQEADNRRLSTLSLPALGTGQKALKPSEVASAIFKAVKSFSAAHVKQVTVVVYQQEMAGEFITELKNIAGLNKHSANRTSEQHRVKRTTESDEHDHNKHRANRTSEQHRAKRTTERGGSHERHERKSSEDNDKEEQKSESTTFFIWSDSRDNIKAVKRDIDKLVETQYKVKKLTDYDKVVKNLKNDKLRDFAREHNVKIKLDNGTVKISGADTNVSKAHEAVSSYLRKEEKEMESKEQAKAMSDYVHWYYKDPATDKFKPFKYEDNIIIEKEYKNKSPTAKIKDSKGVWYTIDFHTMQETCSDRPNTKIKVERRLKEQDKSGVLGVKLPDTWVQMKPSQHLHEELLSPGSKEYDRVNTEFKKSGGTGTIVKIFRVQNPYLYLQYAAKRRELIAKNKKNPERWLWHGTSADTVDKILNNGFNRSYCGKNGTAYGAGVYFAVNASYSVGYAMPGSNGIKHMFSAQVLVGDTCQGSGGMTVLPVKSGLMTYDSSSDNPQNPVMFIIFHDSQAYPSYHILFK